MKTFLCILILCALCGCASKPVYQPPAVVPSKRVAVPSAPPSLPMPPKGQLPAKADAFQPPMPSGKREFVLPLRWPAGTSNGVYMVEVSDDQKNWTNAGTDWSPTGEPTVKFDAQASVKFYRGRKIQ